MTGAYKQTLVLPEFKQYIHYGNKVWVRSRLEGKHRTHCLCFSCTRFKPSDDPIQRRKENCSIANKVYETCVNYNVVLPVWECPDFREKP